MTTGPDADANRRPSRLARIASRSGEAFRLALSRFPFAVGAITFLAFLANLKIAEVDIVAPENEVRMASMLGVAAAVSVAAALVLERGIESAVPRGVGAAGAGVFAALVVWFGWDGTVFVPALSAAAILAVPLAPHLTRSNSMRFWTFTLWTGFGVSLGFLSVLLFVVGVSAILEMIRYLFGVGLNGRSYAHIYATATLLVGPLFALGRIPREFDEELAIGRTDRFVAGIAVLQNWVATPLVLAAAVILHLYAAKILVTGEVPQNQIGWIVSVYSVLVLSLRVAAAPFVGAGSGAAQRLFGSVWLPILLVPIVLLGYAVRLRVGAEGFTLERYYLALAALAVAAIAAAQAPAATRGDIRCMVAVPILLLAVSSFGPWGVASTVGRSQVGFIAREFADVPDGRLHTDDLGDTQRNVLRSRVAALAEVDALSRLRPLMTDAALAQVDAAGQPDRTAFLRALAIDYGAASPEFVSFSAEKATPFDVSGFDMVQNRFDAAESADPIATLAVSPAATIHEGRIELHFRSVVDRIDPKPIVERVLPKDGVGAEAKHEPVDIDVTTLGGRTVRLRVTSLVRPADAGRLTSIVFDMAVRAVEWPPASLGGDRQPR